MVHWDSSNQLLPTRLSASHLSTKGVPDLAGGKKAFNSHHTKEWQVKQMVCQPYLEYPGCPAKEKYTEILICPMFPGFIGWSEYTLPREEIPMHHMPASRDSIFHSDKYYS
jgi:hypothetical protein